MKKLLVFLFIIFCTINIFSQPNIPVFESGKDGHKSYRIPAIIKLNNGHLLAFAEGRVQGASDFGDVTQLALLKYFYRYFNTASEFFLGFNYLS